MNLVHRMWLLVVPYGALWCLPETVRRPSQTEWGWGGGTSEYGRSFVDLFRTCQTPIGAGGFNRYAHPAGRQNWQEVRGNS